MGPQKAADGTLETLGITLPSVREEETEEVGEEEEAEFPLKEDIFQKSTVLQVS